MSADIQQVGGFYEATQQQIKVNHFSLSFSLYISLSLSLSQTAIFQAMNAMWSLDQYQPGYGQTMKGEQVGGWIVKLLCSSSTKFISHFSFFHKITFMYSNSKTQLTAQFDKEF